MGRKAISMPFRRVTGFGEEWNVTVTPLSNDPEQILRCIETYWPVLVLVQ